MLLKYSLFPFPPSLPKSKPPLKKLKRKEKRKKKPKTAHYKLHSFSEPTATRLQVDSSTVGRSSNMQITDCSTAENHFEPLKLGAPDQCCKMFLELHLEAQLQVGLSKNALTITPHASSLRHCLHLRKMSHHGRHI